MRILALDHGAAKCGCAISDPTGTIVKPLDVVSPPDPEVVAQLVEDEEVQRVVIGLPRPLGGGEGKQAEQVRDFGDQLGRMISVEITYHDERFTTKLAQSTRRQGARAMEDSLAAAHLLEDYLSAPPSHGEEKRG